MAATPDEPGLQTVVGLSKEKGSAPAPFDVLTTALTFPTRDQEQWWRKTGPMLGQMLASSGYTLDQQYQHLTFYHNQLVPRLGPHPATFHSSLTVSGLPMEFSINYQQKGAHPTVRIGAEPIDSFSGTERDPFNQIPPAEMVSHFARAGLKGFDPQLYSYFEPKHTLTREQQARLPKEVPGGDKLKTQYAFGFDFKGDEVSLKGYSYPGLKATMAGQEVAKLVRDGVNDLKNQGKLDCTEAWAAVEGYITELNGWGYHNLWAWDYVSPAKSRLKFYSFVMDVADKTKLEELWTLNGRATSPAHQEGLRYLKELWDIIDLKNVGKRDLPADAPQLPEDAAPMVWNYELTAGNPLPFGKGYFPLQGLNDAGCIQKLVKFFELMGWKDLAAKYPETIQSFYPGLDLSKTSNLLMWVSYTYSEKTGVYLSIYNHPCPEK
ncbi:hypothetical protein BDW72DRAFT_109700 [Aspergillus terricola var. indicus]